MPALDEKGPSLIIERSARAAGIAEGKLQAQTRGCLLHPGLGPQWPAAIDTRPNLLGLFVVQSAIDEGQPMSRSLHRPVAQGQRILARRLRPTTSQTRETNAGNEIGSITIGGNTTNLAYDDAGNLTNDGTLKYVYDAWNR